MSFAAQLVTNLAYLLYHFPSDAQFERLCKGLDRSRRQEAVGAVGRLYGDVVPIHAWRLRIEDRHEVRRHVGHRPRAGEICSAKAESVDQRIAQLMPQEMAQIQRCIATVIAVRQIALKVRAFIWL